MYNWDNKTWEDEDIEFAPKRKVNNKGADKKPHMIGSFYSDKMERIIEFESLNEEIIYNILEMDKYTIRYYIQPVEVKVPFLDDTGNLKNWKHVSDVLAFRKGFPPQLFQIKDVLDNENEKLKNCNINEACLSYAQKHKWDYSIVRPKQLPVGILHNINFLSGFIRQRSGYDVMIPKLVKCLSLLVKSTINDLAKAVGENSSPLYYLPAIYHLIATGVFNVNLNIPINGFSLIKLGSQESILHTALSGGMLYEMENNQT